MLKVTDINGNEVEAKFGFWFIDGYEAGEGGTLKSVILRCGDLRIAFNPVLFMKAGFTKANEGKKFSVNGASITPRLCFLNDELISDEEEFLLRANDASKEDSVKFSELEPGDVVLDHKGKSRVFVGDLRLISLTGLNIAYGEEEPIILVEHIVKKNISMAVPNIEAIEKKDYWSLYGGVTPYLGRFTPGAYLRHIPEEAVASLVDYSDSLILRKVFRKYVYNTYNETYAMMISEGRPVPGFVKDKNRAVRVSPEGFTPVYPEECSIPIYTLAIDEDDGVYLISAPLSTMRDPQLFRVDSEELVRALVEEGTHRVQLEEVNLDEAPGTLYLTDAIKRSGQ